MGESVGFGPAVPACLPLVLGELVVEVPPVVTAILSYAVATTAGVAAISYLKEHDVPLPETIARFVDSERAKALDGQADPHPGVLPSDPQPQESKPPSQNGTPPPAGWIDAVMQTAAVVAVASSDDCASGGGSGEVGDGAEHAHADFGNLTPEQIAEYQKAADVYNDAPGSTHSPADVQRAVESARAYDRGSRSGRPVRQPMPGPTQPYNPSWDLDGRGLSAEDPNAIIDSIGQKPKSSPPAGNDNGDQGASPDGPKTQPRRKKPRE